MRINNMKKVLVTGGSGLIGGRLKKKMPEAIFVSSKDFDLTNQDEVKKMFYTYKPDVVIHLAAKAGGLVDNIKHPVSHLNDNLLMNTFVLKYAYESGVKRFLSILSCCVYPDNCDCYPIKEESMYSGAPNDSVFSYGLSKRVMATQIENYNKEFSTKYNYIIPCNLYGIGDKEDKIIPIIIDKIIFAKKNKNSFITLFGDGTPLRQFMNSDDIADIIKYIYDNNITESFNVAPNNSITINDVAKIALTAADAEYLEIRYDKDKPNGQIRRDLDVSKFNSIMPNYKFTQLFDGVREYYKNICNE
jgi:GDP-L-fucose synthase